MLSREDGQTVARRVTAAGRSPAAAYWLVGMSARYHRLMPDTTEKVRHNSDPTPPAQTTMQRWLAPATLLVAVVAVGLAIWALMSSSSAGTDAHKLAGDPKTRVCTAFDTVSKAVSLQTHANLGPEPVALEAVAGNARLALVGGGQYLLSRLDSATPRDLADAVSSFANDLQDIGMYALTGVDNSEAGQAGRMAQGDVARKQIIDLCK